MDLGLPNWSLTCFFGGWEIGVTDAELGGGVIRGKEEFGRESDRRMIPHEKESVFIVLFSSCSTPFRCKTCWTCFLKL